VGETLVDDRALHLEKNLRAMRPASISRKARRLRGARTTVMSRVSTARQGEKANGEKDAFALMPREVRAMISLSMDMRPRPRRTPMSTAMEW